MDIIQYYPDEIDENCRVNLNLKKPEELWTTVGVDNYFLGFALTRLLLQLALINVLTHCLHLLLKRINLPRISSEILAGILLGKTILGRILKQTEHQLFPDDDIFLDTFSKLGFIFFMFLVGVKIDPLMVKKAGSKGWTIGLVASVIPILVAVSMSAAFDFILPMYRRPSGKSILGVLTSTPFPVIVSLLIDLKIMNSELGHLSLTSTLISDLTSTFVQTLQSSMRILFAGSIATLYIVLQDFLLIGFIIILRPLFLQIIKSTPEGKPVKTVYISFICAWVLASAIICDNMGLNYNLAPFLIGLTVPDGPPLGSTITDKMDTLVTGLLAPLMLTYCAIRIDLLVVFDLLYVQIIWVTIFMIVILKFVCILAVALMKNVPIRDALTISTIIGAQGMVQAAFYDNFFRNQTVDDETFGVVILSILIVASVTHLLVKSFYDDSRIYTGYQKRSIMHTSANAELRILACVHRHDDAMAAIKLLEAVCPSRENPISVYALQLVELMGRSAPLLINHKLGQKNSTSSSRSQQMIDLFDNFELQYMGWINVQAFTAVSLPIFMHQDICSLAFDKMTSLIVLPFHRKWNQLGNVAFDSNSLRTLNQSVLEIAPCSVGIFVDRRKIRRKMDDDTDLHENQHYKIGIIFIGGGDDREALALGKRMMRSTEVDLTVVRITPQDEDSSGKAQWDKVLDAETLKDLKYQSIHLRNVTYKEEKVKDGPETTWLVNAMVDVFDLIVVGRRHRQDSPVLSGLWEWTELSELGPVGDILASPDIHTPVSVLVVQQQ